MGKRGSKIDSNYVEWLTESTLEEAPLDDLKHVGKRAAKRAALFGKSLLTPSADGEIDVMDTTAKLRNHYLRDTKAIGKPFTMQTLTDFLYNNYNGLEIDPTSGQVLNPTDRAEGVGQKTEPESDPSVKDSGTFGTQGQNNVSTGQTKSADAKAADAAIISATPSDVQEPEGTQSTQGPEGTKGTVPPEATTKAAETTRKTLNTNIASKDGEAALKRAQALLLSPNPSPTKVMQSIQSLLSAVQRDNNPQEKKFVADWLRKMRDERVFAQRVPQLNDLTDDMLKKLSENWVRTVDCAIYLVEADVQDADDVREAVKAFFTEAYRPNAKLDRATLDKVLTGVAKYLISIDAVDFGDTKRGNANTHIRNQSRPSGGSSEAGSMAAATAARTGQTARPAGSQSAETTDAVDSDSDGVPDNRDIGVSARLDVREFEEVLNELNMTDAEIAEVFNDAHTYRNNPRALYDTINNPAKVDWAKRIAVAAMVSILVQGR